MSENIFDPPRIGTQFIQVWEKYLKPNEAYLNAIITWAEKLPLREWYFLQNNVKEKDMLLFKYCFCYMIGVYDMPYEFKNDYSAIRRIEPVIKNIRPTTMEEKK
jgi:hypothetical protein